MLLNAKVFDIEANGLNPDKIWCLSMKGFDSTDDYDQMRKQLLEADYLVGHDIIRYDIPVLEKLLGVKIRAKLVDTLALSWYLYPSRPRHGLEYWGEEFGIPKPVILEGEWLGPLEGETFPEFRDKMFHRCSEDVKINSVLWDKQLKYLMKLYDQDEKQVRRLIAYLTFKMQCARLQGESRWKVNVPKVEALIEKLSKEEEARTEALREAMPKVPDKAVQKPPKKPYKLNGELSAIGLKWQALLKEKGLPEDHREPVEIIKGWDLPNPGSHSQIKDWLFGLGWEPATFDFKRNKETGEVRKIPQVSTKDEDDNSVLCPSVLLLADKEPAIKEFEGLSIVKHRLGLLRGFLNNHQDGWLKAEVGGLTNTLRFKHRVLVNLPGVDKLYGEDIRGALEAPEGYELCGSDMSSLEDRTKQHFMWPHDPEYVKEMQKPDFDPHLDLALLAKAITKAQVDAYKAGDKKPYTPIRKVYKATNYAAVYGSGATTLARTSGVTVPKATGLLEVYWKRNWSVRRVAEETRSKTCNGDKWLYNPVSKFWYSLRHEKDKFSTLNQGTGVYCFDTWVKHILSKRPQLTGQFHDEVILCIKKGSREKCVQLLRWAIDKTNEELKLNRELDVDVEFGSNYAQIH